MEKNWYRYVAADRMKTLEILANLSPRFSLHFLCRLSSPPPTRGQNFCSSENASDLFPWWRRFVIEDCGFEKSVCHAQPIDTLFPQSSSQLLRSFYLPASFSDPSFPVVSSFFAVIHRGSSIRIFPAGYPDKGTNFITTNIRRIQWQYKSHDKEEVEGVAG